MIVLGYPRRYPRVQTMDTDKLQRIQAHAREIAASLYGETPAERLTSLEGIEAAVREHLLNSVSPEIGVF